MVVETLIAIAVGGVTVYGGVYKYGIAPYLRRKKEKKESASKITADFYERLENKINSLSADTQSVKKQVFFNGGSSVMDAIHSVKESVARIEDTIISLEDGQRMMLNIQKVAFWYSDKDGEMIYASPVLCKLIGHSESEIMGNNWMGVIDSVDRDRIIKAWETSMELVIPFDEIYNIRMSDGHLIKVHALAFHRKVKGEQRGVIGRLEELK